MKTLTLKWTRPDKANNTWEGHLGKARVCVLHADGDEVISDFEADVTPRVWVLTHLMVGGLEESLTDLHLTEVKRVARQTMLAYFEQMGMEDVGISHKDVAQPLGATVVRSVAGVIASNLPSAVPSADQALALRLATLASTTALFVVRDRLEEARKNYDADDYEEEGAASVLDEMIFELNKALHQIGEDA